MVNYHDKIIEKINSFISNKISLPELIHWANISYDKFFYNHEHEQLENRLINDIFIRLREFEDEIEDLEDLNEKERDYVNEECKVFLNQLAGNVNYIEVYKILNDDSVQNSDLNKLFNDVYELLNNGEVLSHQLLERVKWWIDSNQCKSRTSIIISEILHSILFVNESIKVKSDEIFIGTLGMCKNKHSYKDELKYLNSLLCAFKGECEYRFTIALNANKVLYTSIYII